MNNIKHWIFSSLQTFLTGALIAILPVLEGKIEWTTAFWASIALTGLRAGIKAIAVKLAEKNLVPKA